MTTRLWQNGIQIAQHASQSVVDFLCPPTCVLCQTDRSLFDGEDGNRRGERNSVSQPLLCSSCVAELKPISSELACDRCGAPAGQYLDLSKGCVHCSGDRFAFDRVFALGVYADRMRAVCLQAKHPAGRLVAAGLGQTLFQQTGDRIEAEKIDFVLPVPRHWLHKLKSSYSASSSLAEIVSNCLKAPLLPHILQKSRRTASQSSLPPSKRRSNLRGAFQYRSMFGLAKRKLSGSTVLLVDDILTTGSTAHEISRVLKQAGVRRVVVAVAARGIAASSVSVN